ncbi:uncharacterized protein LOC123292978 [Chrysoperla carnea]|uniref:uncharacterized protein LOC123292978 n=1 Tax=Chrysoperla carnea TaxID=189513 RepID=UPI001D07A53D|nr:uncharacterized protein LOC123292978 [Chrysoperla carnea]
MPTSQEKAASDLQVLVARRERYFQSIQQAFDLIPRLKDLNICRQFKARCKTLDKAYSEFDAVQNKILETNALAAVENRISDVLASSQAFDDLFYAVRAAEASWPEPQTVSTPSAPTIKPKLPHITLPTFDGTYEKFDSFKSLFDTLIHNQGHLSTIEKYSYLRSSVSGTALTAIQGLPFAENSYETAYKTLVTRFTNKRVIASNVCQKLFSVKPFTQESQLKGFLEDFNVQVEALNNLALTSVSDFLISFMALRLLDPQTRQAFEDTRANDPTVPTYADIRKFVEGRIATCEVINSSSAKTNYPKPMGSMKVPVKRAMVAHASPPLKPSVQSTSSKPADLSHTCPCCAKSHRVVECNQFGNMTISQRYDVLRKKLLCFSCFGPHARSTCSSKFSCRHCGSKAHHTMLHNDSKANIPPISSASEPTVALSGNIMPSPSVHQHKQILLGTAIVSIPDVFGHHHDVRVLIDPGSMINIISQSLKDRLTLPMTASNIRISGIGSGKPQPAKGTVVCTVNSKHSPFSITVEAAVLPTIATKIPAVPVVQNIVNKLSQLQLADPQFYSPASVEMLIGAQHYANLLTSEPVVPGHPSLVPSMFGTLVMGECPSMSSNEYQSYWIMHSDTDLSYQLQKFWEVEELPVETPLNPEDVKCEEHFVKTHRRDSDGAYIVRLPFRNGEAPELGDNRVSALNRLTKLEKRLEKQPTFKDLYHANLQDYLSSGHMVLAEKNSSYVLTHHGVTKDSSTTKVRVVFNPAEKTNATFPSLNETLLAGPKLQNSINDIILNFRLHRVAITGDVKQMYRAIKLDARDSKFQQILWRFDPSQPVQQYEITRVCFGITSSPYHALRVMKQLIQDEGFKYPTAAKVLETDMYIDDVCTGASSIAEARQLRVDLSALLSTAGFELRKWASSHAAVLSDLPHEYKEKPHKFGDIETIQVLGIQWISEDDVFCYRIETIPNCTTKRQVLSQIARTYDLPGFLGPVVIWMKILMQKIWLQGIDWDDPLPSRMIDQWSQFAKEMPCLQTIKIPRDILDTYIHPPELVGFSDASSSAMAAAVYLRVVYRTLPSQWFHVPTADNPADIASRGCMPSQLVNHKLWWSGPDFLREDFSLWPSQEVASVPDLPDLKEVGPSLIGHVTGGDDGVVLLLERFSSLKTHEQVSHHGIKDYRTVDEGAKSNLIT